MLSGINSGNWIIRWHGASPWALRESAHLPLYREIAEGEIEKLDDLP
jgi:hypothetical protein